jgi:hypothetical protein
MNTQPLVLVRAIRKDRVNGELEPGPDQLSAPQMGYVHEELLRPFSEQSGRGGEIRTSLFFASSLQDFDGLQDWEHILIKSEFHVQ